MSTHTLSALVENKPGVLAHVAGLFSRRSFNISSLAVGPTADEEVEPDDDRGGRRVHPGRAGDPAARQAGPGDQGVELADDAAVERELALIKLAADPPARAQILQIAEVFGASVVDLAPESIVLEATGSPGKVEALLAVLAPYGIRELARTGRVGLDRGPSAITDHEGPGVPGPRAAVPESLAQAS
jgi:Acetolactate synthase, small (regulatory) subunit